MKDTIQPLFFSFPFRNVELLFGFCCATAEQWTDETIRALAEFYSHSNRKDSMLHSWKLPKRGWGWNSWSSTTIYGREDFSTLQSKTRYQRCQREEIKGLIAILFLSPLWFIDFSDSRKGNCSQYIVGTSNYLLRCIFWKPLVLSFLFSYRTVIKWIFRSGFVLLFTLWQSSLRWIWQGS